MTKIRSTRSGRVRRGSRAGTQGFGLGSPLGRSRSGLRVPLRAGGGIVGIIAIVVIAVISGAVDIGSDGDDFDGLTGAPAGETSCTTELERIVCGAVDDVSAYWERQFPRSFQGPFPGTDTVLFSGRIRTGCGLASAQVGPFYCPADQLVYFDLEMLSELQDRFGAQGDLAAQYIVAHEYAHHVQNVSGIADRVDAERRRHPEATNALSVAQELQADCFAGAWANSVAERNLLDDPSEIAEGQRAAAAVGDDRIMEASGTTVQPEQFTHGSAEQRQEWFTLGFDTGDPERCTTFGGSLAP